MNYYYYILFLYLYSINLLIPIGRRKRTLHLYAVTATNLVLPRANAETSHSVRYNLVVVVISIIGGSEKFSYGMVRSRKPPLSAPYDNSNTILLLRHLYDPI
jgi:hypothetical protein